jgi:superfamily II DNA/RNA helicase
MFDELATDSKYHALLNLLDSLGPLVSPERRVLVLTKFFDTATYLENLLRETYSRVGVLTGRDSFTDRREVLANFVQEGGILIATDVVQIQVPEVTNVVFYDLPLSLAALEARMDRFVRVGRRSPIRIFAFTDESNALPIEPYQRKIVEFNEPLSESEIEQALLSKQAR